MTRREGRPGGDTETAHQLAKANAKSSRPARVPDYGHDRHEPLTAEDRADAQVLAAAYERGYRLAVQCTRCGQWLVSPSSVRSHIGPVCRMKTQPKAAGDAS